MQTNLRYLPSISHRAKHYFLVPDINHFRFMATPTDDSSQTHSRTWTTYTYAAPANPQRLSNCKRTLSVVPAISLFRIFFAPELIVFRVCAGLPEVPICLNHLRFSCTGENNNAEAGGGNRREMRIFRLGYENQRLFKRRNELLVLRFFRLSNQIIQSIL